jgi:threonine/homoserine/homoserine lactone efflux protein
VTPTLAAYVTVTFLLVLTPGMTTAVVIQQSVRHGRRAGAAAALGAAAGNSTHALAAGAGIALLLRRWPAVFDALQIAGALYLIWLGLSTLWRGRAANRHVPAGSEVPDAASAMRQGLLATLLNPSSMAFYLTVVPGFVAPTDPPGMFFLLGAIHVTIAFTVHLCWATAFDALRRVIARPAGLRTLDMVAGLGLIALGALLLMT